MESLEAMNIIRHYVEKQLSYREISEILEKIHSIKLSSNAIRKKAKKMGMPSRRGPTNNSTDEIKMTIQRLLPDLPHTVGYRQMTDILRQKNYHVRRDQVMKLMKEIDPLAVNFRGRRRIKRKIYRTNGPNHIWHVDGYDKLKPYGFPIHGCIDGYSRKILWLEVGPSNNNPDIVAFHYVRCVDELKGCPTILQTDPGTENCVMGALQCTFRHYATDDFAGPFSFRVVKSVLNQRIEAWWSMLRRQQSDWWISFFKDLEAFGGFQKGNRSHICSIRFCFMPVIQHDLDLLMDRWNHHYISNSRQSVCPGGRPTFMYDIPDESRGFLNCLQPLQEEDIRFAYSVTEIASRSGSPQFDLQAQEIFRLNGWVNATDWQQALQQYFKLLHSNIIS